MSNPKSWYANYTPELYPQPHNVEQGWVSLEAPSKGVRRVRMLPHTEPLTCVLQGLTFFLRIHDGPTGSAPGTGHWAGLPNLFWWADRETGLGGIIGSQIIPFGGKLRNRPTVLYGTEIAIDLKVLGLWGEIEAGLYSAVKGGGSK